jgi:hypothetical protein
MGYRSAALVNLFVSAHSHDAQAACGAIVWCWQTSSSPLCSSRALRAPQYFDKE